MRPEYILEIQKLQQERLYPRAKIQVCKLEAQAEVKPFKNENFEIDLIEMYKMETRWCPGYIEDSDLDDYLSHLTTIFHNWIDI